jgi:hypothetical protein
MIPIILANKWRRNMNKFFVLVIKSNKELVRAYINNDEAKRILVENEDWKLYRGDNTQEAVIHDNKIFWVDVNNVDKV